MTNIYRSLSLYDIYINLERKLKFGGGGGANPQKICNAYIMSIIVKKSWDVHGSWIYTYHQMKLTVTVSNEKKQNKVFKFNDPTAW